LKREMETLVEGTDGIGEGEAFERGGDREGRQMGTRITGNVAFALVCCRIMFQTIIPVHQNCIK
jgi:hypothetical protein